MKTFIPFSGFYQSAWDGALDYEIERLQEDLRGDNGEDLREFGGFDFSGFDAGKIDWHFHIDVSADDWRNMVRAWVLFFSHNLESESSVAGQRGVTVTFAEHIGCRDYAMGNDRIECTISRDNVRAMRKRVNNDALVRVAAERHTSRDGFWSFYDPDITTWGRVDQWDANQVETLLIAFLESEGIEVREDDAIDRLQGNGFFSDIVDRSFNAAKLYEELSK